MQIEQKANYQILIAVAVGSLSDVVFPGIN